MPRFYAPKPQRIKCVVVSVQNGTGATYPTILAALAAVYRLTPAEQNQVREIIIKSAAKDAA